MVSETYNYRVKKPRVTIAVALYNSEKYIGYFIDAILKQTFQDYELIFVVDHKTTDNTIQIINQRMESYNNVLVVIQEDDDGLGGARNLGIEKSNGDVIWFVDVDDYQYPCFLEEMIEIMDQNDADIVFCNHFQEKRSIIPAIPDLEYSVDTFSRNEALTKFADFPVYSWSRIQKKKIFSSGIAYFNNYRTMEDLEQTILSIMECNTICYYNKPLYVYYKNPSSASKRNRHYEAGVIEQTTRHCLQKVKEEMPDCLDSFSIAILKRLMRQMAFVEYTEYRHIYEESIAHEIIGNHTDRTLEMKIFEFSPALYYYSIFVFTHYIWDNHTGAWKKV